MAKVWKVPQPIYNHLPKRANTTELTPFYALYHRNGNQWHRASMVSYTFGFALRVWSDKLVCYSNDYKLREVDVKG